MEAIAEFALAGGDARLVGPQGGVVRLGPAPQHRGKGVAGRADVPPGNPGTFGRLDRDDLPHLGEAHLVRAVHVEVQQLRGAQGAQRRVGGVLGRDQVLVRRQPHVADVDPAEQPVPVAVVGLAAVEMVAGGRPGDAVGHRRHLARRAQHLLVEVVDLAVPDLEVAPEATAQPARRRVLAGLAPRGAGG